MLQKQKHEIDFVHFVILYYILLILLLFYESSNLHINIVVGQANFTYRYNMKKKFVNTLKLFLEA